MTTKKSIVRNILWNWSGQFVQVLVGFFIAPFLVLHLGETDYGLWIVIGSLTGYFGLLDLGVRTSVGRFLAFYRAKKDLASANGILSTAAVFLVCAGLVAVLGTLCVQFFFFEIYDVPAAEVDSARLALWLVGINLALTLPLTLFDATLWAMQRFDMMNWVDMLTAVAQAGLTVWFIGSGYRLVALALITIAMTLVRGFAKMTLSFWEEPGLRFGRKYLQKSAAGTLMGYGVWRVIMAVCNIGITRLNPLVIGAWLGVMMVTPYALAARLMAFVTQIMAAVRGVLTPAATELHAQERPQWQLTFMVHGGRFSAALGLAFLIGFYFLGESFFTLWIGPKLASAWLLLFVLMAGEFLPLYQSATSSMLLGMARHQVLAYVGLMELAASLGLGLAALLWTPYGLLGICLAQAIAAAICRGLIQMVYACRLLGQPLLPYLARSLLPAAAAAAIPAALLGMLVAWHTPQTWLEMVLYGLGYAVCYLVSCLFLVGMKQVGGGMSRLLPMRLRTKHYRDKKLGQVVRTSLPVGTAQVSHPTSTISLPAE